MPQSLQGRLPSSRCLLWSVILLGILLGMVGMHHAAAAASPTDLQRSASLVHAPEAHHGQPGCSDPVREPVCPPRHDSLHSCMSLPGMAGSTGSSARLWPVPDYRPACRVTSPSAMFAADRGPPGLPSSASLARLGVLRL
jgi:hypothetical protein